MTVKINTKDGQIELTDDVIATIVGGAATEIFGVVGMASKNAIKDNFQALLGKENYAKVLLSEPQKKEALQLMFLQYLVTEQRLVKFQKTFRSA